MWTVSSFLWRKNTLHESIHRTLSCRYGLVRFNSLLSDAPATSDEMTILFDMVESHGPLPSMQSGCVLRESVPSRFGPGESIGYGFIQLLRKYLCSGSTSSSLQSFPLICSEPSSLRTWIFVFSSG